MANYMMDDPAAARTPLQQAASGPGDFSGKPDIPARLAFLDKVQSGTASQDDIQAALKLQPDDVFAQIALGDLAARQGDSAKAAASYKQALDRNPDLLAVTLDLAGLDAGPLHDLNRAFDLASKARELAPADPAVAELLGKIVYARGDFLQAYSLLQEAISSGTDDLKAAGALQDFAWSAYSQGKAAEARTAMQRITAAAPPDSPEAQDASSFLSLTDPALTPDQLAADEAQVTKLLQATPDYVPALMVRAQIRLSHGDTHGAVDDYTAVLRRFPDFPLAQMDLAHLYLQDPATQDQAYDLAEKAHKALPDDPEATRLLAAVSYQRKDYSYAIQLLQVSGQSQPLDAESQFYLGMACWQLKEKPQSRDALGSAIAGGLSGPRLDEAKRVLAELQAK
jgi:predicted Zn-dependent protease